MRPVTRTLACAVLALGVALQARNLAAAWSAHRPAVRAAALASPFDALRPLAAAAAEAGDGAPLLAEVTPHEAVWLRYAVYPREVRRVPLGTQAASGAEDEPGTLSRAAGRPAGPSAGRPAGRREAPPAEAPPARDARAVAAPALRAAAALALSTWCGVAWLAALGLAGFAGRAARLSLGYGLGLGAVALLLVALDAARLPWSLPLVAGALVALGLAGRAAGRRTRLALAVTPPVPPSPWATTGARFGAALPAALLALTTLVVAAVAVLSWRAGADFDDTHAVWLLRAKAWFVDGGFDGALFRGWTDAHDRRGYPPLVSLAGTWTHIAVGSAHEGTAKLVFAGFFAATVVLLHAALRLRLTPLPAAALTALFALTAPGLRLAIWGTGDLPLAFFLLAAVLAAAATPRAAAPAALAACAALAKNEGLVVAAGLALALALLRRRRDALAVACAAGAAALLWWIVLAVHDVPVRATPPALAPEALAGGAGGLAGKASLVGDHLLDVLVHPGWWLLWLIFPFACTTALRRRLGRTAFVAAVVVLAQAGAYLVIYLGYDGDLALLLRTTQQRLPYHVLAPALLVVAAACSSRAVRPEHATRA